MTLLCRLFSTPPRRKRKNGYARRLMPAVAPLEWRVLQTVMPSIPSAGFHGAVAVHHMHHEVPQAHEAAGGMVHVFLRHAVS
jgi:hypothetical protein